MRLIPARFLPAAERSNSSADRAKLTSNTFWDWNIDHVGSAYGMMDEVFQFVGTFDEFPPRSFPPSFNPANV